MRIERVKLAIFVMVLISVNAVCLIFMIIPLVIVMMGLVVVDDNAGLPFGSEGSRSQCERGYQGGAQKGRTAEQWNYSHTRDQAVVSPIRHAMAWRGRQMLILSHHAINSAGWYRLGLELIELFPLSHQLCPFGTHFPGHRRSRRLPVLIVGQNVTAQLG